MPTPKLSKPYRHSHGWSLTPEDVKGLMEATSQETLIGVTRKIADVYSERNLGNADAKAAEQIFRLLLRETEIQVRQTLAEHIKNCATIPKDIVMALAQDVAEVALPILQHSEVLTDDDLIDLIDNSDDINLYLAISRRARLSQTLSRVLLDKNNDTVTIALVNNEDAIIAEDKLIGLVAKKQTNVLLMEALSRRPHLPITVVEKLIHVVSASMGESLKEKYSLQRKSLETEVDKTRESETLKLIDLSESQEDISKLVEQLIAFSRLSPSLILSSLCHGNFRFFETSLASLSNIPLHNARTLINDRGDLGFRAIYNKSGLPESLFPAVRLLLRVIHALDEAGEKPGNPGYSNRVIEDIVKQSEITPVENLSYLIALVRRSPQP